MKRPNMKKQLKKRTDNSYKTKDSGSKIGILKVPDNASFMEIVDKKRYKIDIIPFQITTKNYPDPEVYQDDEDEIWHYKLDVWVHRFIGFAEGDYVCLRKNFNKPCPICEDYDFLKKENNVDEDVLQNLKPSRRVLYNVYDCEEEEMYLFSTSHYLFEKELIDEAYTQKDGEVITFYDIDDGYHIKFRTLKVIKKGRTFFEFKSFSFVEREEPISTEILKKAISLDEILIIPSYQDMKDALHGIDTEDDKDEEESDTVEKEEKQEKKKTERKSKQEKKKKRTSECPYDYHFGEDCEEYTECDSCNVWEECSEHV